MKIKYKPIPENLKRMVAPIESKQSNTRSSLGLENVIGEFNYISIEDLTPHSNQARKVFDQAEIEAMAETIKQYGIKQPLTIVASPNQNGRYEVVSGERRLRAAKLAGLDRVPCIITNDTTQTDAIALIENIHRKDLHPIELGIAYKKLLEKGIFNSARSLANKVSVAESVVSEYLQYADLPEKVQEKIFTNKSTSREQLRGILKKYALSADKTTLDLEDIKSFSVMRVRFTNNGFQFQVNGLDKLGQKEKEIFKKNLKELLAKLEQ